MALLPEAKNCDISVKRNFQIISSKLGYNIAPNFANLTLTDLTTSSLIGTNATKLLESVTVGTGLDYTRPTLSLSHLGIEALTDPGADKILFWDDSASASKWLGMGNFIAITDVTLDLEANTQTLLDSFNGIFLETIAFTISESGGTVTGSLEQDGTGDLIQRFSDGYSILDCTPVLTIDLTAYVGTDVIPVEVFVYILQSAKTVMAASNSDWPATEHIKVANLVLRSAATTGTDGGALVNRNWNDHAQSADSQGHITHIEQRIRQEPTQWDSGVALTLKDSAGNALTTGNSSTAVELVTSAGTSYQLHKHTFAAIDMYTTATDKAHIVNQPTNEDGAYVTTVDLVTDVSHYVDGTAAGVAIGVNKYFNLVIWGVQNRTGEISHLMINLPIGQYTNEAAAIADASGYSVFDLPAAFKGVGFLIARLTFRLIAGVQWTYIAQEDLRGQIPPSTAGVSITTTAHDLLANLDFASAGHTGFQAQGDVLDDLNTTGANTFTGDPVNDFLVGTAAGTLVWQYGATARTSMGVGTGDSPTFAGLTLTNAAVISSDSVVFQPNTDSTTFFQVLDADGGTSVLNVDTTNEFVGIRCVPAEAILDIGGWVAKPANMETIGLNVKGDFFAGNAGTGQGRYRVGSNFAAGFLYWNSYYESVAAELRAMDSDNRAFRVRFDGQNDRIQFSRAAATAGAQSFVDMLVIDTSNGYVGMGPEVNSSGPVRMLHVSGDQTSGAYPYLHMTDEDSGHTINDGMTIGLFGEAGYIRVRELWPLYFTTSNTIRVSILSGGEVGINEQAPETLTEWTSTAPYLTLHNSTHEDTDGGRESRLNFKGEQSGSEETTLARIEVGHDGIVDDQKGYWKLFINDGNDGDAPTEALEIDSARSIKASGNTISDSSGNLTSANGASFGPAGVTSITVVNGIVTAIS